jgi:5-methylcytosine-specific restriction enzyme A
MSILRRALGLHAKKPGDNLRSTHWRSVRAAHLKLQPTCQVCGTSDKLNVHHVLPFHLHPDLELEQDNLITLCEGADGGCHLRFGHLWSWHSFNKSVRSDAIAWSRKKAKRPA